MKNEKKIFGLLATDFMTIDKQMTFNINQENES
jgi:hypothetical protein